MNKIPLWGKIAGGCGLLLIIFLVIAGCSAVVLVAGSDSPEPSSAPETTTSQKTEEPTESEEPETTIPEEPEVDTTGGINTCIPDNEESMAEVVASFTSADVTIYSDEVYVVTEDLEMTAFYVVAGSDVGTIMLYIDEADTDEPMGYAANDIAYDYTMLFYPEDMGADPIDTDSDAYLVAEGCVW